MNCSANESRVKACFDYAECSQQCPEGEIKCNGTLFFRETIILELNIILKHDKLPLLLSLSPSAEEQTHFPCAQCHVRPSTPIAITGNSGSRSTGPHLHLTLKDTKKGRAIDPSILLRLIQKQNAMCLAPPEPQWHWQ